MIRRLLIFTMFVAAAVLNGCATAPPFPETSLQTVDRSLTPERAARDTSRNVQVLWGGVIIGAINLTDHTDFNVLFYPLDKSQRPDLDKPPLHTLPHDELIAKLHSLTNLRAVRDAGDPTGWKIDVGPFPGWAEVPTW